MGQDEGRPTVGKKPRQQRRTPLSNDLTARIDETIRKKSLLRHPFYEAWTMGSLPLDSLRDYAGQYYHFELAYPTFLSGLHYRCQDQGIRQLLLDNLWDEEHGPENHVELWLRFCDGLGLDREDVRSGEPGAETEALVQTFSGLTSTGSLAAGAATLYAYESQVPEVAKAKLDGLRRFYGMDDARTVSFFQVHQTLDEEHSAAEIEMVRTLASTTGEQSGALEAVDQATDALWRFLDGVY
jgi:pyrroloquinoline-quinone synthase